MKKKHFVLFFLCALSLTVSCGGDSVPDELQEVRYAVFDGMDMPSEVPWSGGDYTVRTRFSPVARSVTDDRPWSVRLVISGVAEPAIHLEEETEATLRVSENLTETTRTVVVELCSDAVTWTQVARAEQEAGLIRVTDTWWTRGNLTLRVPAADTEHYRFVAAPTPEEPGLFFNRLSRWGVRSDEPSYSGTAYSPEPSNIPLSDLPEADGDPCRSVGDGRLRTPTFGELRDLLERCDPEVTTVGGMPGLGFDGGRLFLPFAGACDRRSGTIGYQRSNGGYWGLGISPEGEGAVLFLSGEYAGLDYSAGTSMASVRCVKNTRVPTYVSHAPENAPSGAAVRLTVTTDPGEAEHYGVRLLASDGTDMEVVATAGQPVVGFDVPANQSHDRMVFRILVDGTDTGREFIQPGVTGYATYVGHTPQQAGNEAFTLIVTCRSDLESFPVRIEDGGKIDETVYATSAQPVARFQVPENTAAEPRVVFIYVNGADTGKSVVQAGSPVRPPEFSVVWSPGFLTVRDGMYAFAPERERGLYFKYGSRYGMTLNTAEPSSASGYSGTAYGPEITRMSYAEIPASQVDPCSLVAPEGTWRMPAAEEWRELLASDFDFMAGEYRSYTDGDQKVFLTPSGSLKKDGSGMLGSSFVRVWSSTAKDAETYLTLSGGLSSVSSVFSVTVGAEPEAAMMVRCVRAR